MQTPPWFQRGGHVSSCVALTMAPTGFYDSMNHAGLSRSIMPKVFLVARGGNGSILGSSCHCMLLQWLNDFTIVKMHVKEKERFRTLEKIQKAVYSAKCFLDYLGPWCTGGMAVWTEFGTRLGLVLLQDFWPRTLVQGGWRWGDGQRDQGCFLFRTCTHPVSGTCLTWPKHGSLTCVQWEVAAGSDLERLV